jgi:hypothetical protein
MTEKRRFPLPVIVATGFAVPIALAAFIGYLLRDVPTQEETCTKTCAAKHQIGQLVPVYTWTQTAGTGGRGPRECQCK